MEQQPRLDTLEPKHIPAGDGGHLTQVVSSQRTRPIDQSRSTTETAKKLARKAKEHSAGVTEKVKQGVKSQADDLMNVSRDQARGISKAARKAVDELDGNDSNAGSSAFEWVSEKMDGVADFIDARDVDELAEEARHWIKKNPGLTLGGLAIAGFTAGRILRSESLDQTS
ncbi:MAG: hypothetical protein P1U68_05525 [Verrucomicrobiales bacterium]|nr:hypothetical protein [Verrucomicrobiales bacterium]